MSAVEGAARPLFDLTQDEWRVIATDAGDGRALIEFFRGGQPFRSIEGYPTYKVWNIAAHLDEIVADFERGVAVASGDGLGGSVGYRIVATP